ncbi:MAG: YchJ family metal-binding protein [Aliarcobacter sp.]|nr:YchJ family metal-binding protein [Aliarcobacter sp.]
MKLNANNHCPCGSLQKYKKCCKVFHDKIKLPKTALELMKSRFSAFAVQNTDYIIFTTHKDNSDFTSNIESWTEDILSFSQNTNFEKLEILDFSKEQINNIESYVTFKATLKQKEEDISFVEKSRFLKENEKWLYVDGQFID